MIRKLRINRIRLEFKDILGFIDNQLESVLIESDWNLKEEADEEIEKREKGINRIRLEFKAIV